MGECIMANGLEELDSLLISAKINSLIDKILIDQDKGLEK